MFIIFIKNKLCYIQSRLLKPKKTYLLFVKEFYNNLSNFKTKNSKTSKKQKKFQHPKSAMEACLNKKKIGKSSNGIII